MALLVRVLDSKPKGCGIVQFLSLDNFIYPTLLSSTQLQMNTNYREGICDELVVSHSGEKSLALRKLGYKPSWHTKA